MKIQTEIEITDQQISDLIVTAVEGGSNYWYMIAGYQEPEVIDFRCDTFCEDEKPHRIYDWPLCRGGAVIFEDIEGEYKDLLLNRESIRKGLTLMAEHHNRRFASVMDGNYDAEDADVFLQLCLFGEVIFG